MYKYVGAIESLMDESYVFFFITSLIVGSLVIMCFILTVVTYGSFLIIPLSLWAYTIHRRVKHNKGQETEQ